MLQRMRVFTINTEYFPTMPTTLGFGDFPLDQLPADLALLTSPEHQELRDEFEVELLSEDSEPDNLEEFDGSEPEDPDHLANFKRLRELLSHCTFVFEAYEDNALLYGYWHGGDDSISVHDAAMVTYDSEGQITFEPDMSILEELCYRKAFSEAEIEGGDERGLLAPSRFVDKN